MVFQKNVSLLGFNTFKIGGNAKFFCVVKTIDELKEAVEFAKNNKLQFFVLGGGSNTLFSDEGFEGLLIKMEIAGRSFEKIFDKEVYLNVATGENWDRLVNFAVENDFYGIENLSGIPGTVGGAAVQNIGAYGAEVGNSIIEVEVLDVSDMKIKILRAENCLFSYRDSLFKKPEGKNYVVTRVLFSFKKDGKLNTEYKDIREYFKNKNSDKITLEDLQSAVLSIRARKFPDLKTYGTAGSFFKNPTVAKNFYEQLREKYPKIPVYMVGGENFRIPLAWVLDNVCDLKGFRKGTVGLYENQPLVLVNFGGASANEIKNFANEIARKVKEKTEIEIEPEVVFV